MQYAILFWTGSDVPSGSGRPCRKRSCLSSLTQPRDPQASMKARRESHPHPDTHGLVNAEKINQMTCSIPSDSRHVQFTKKSTFKNSSYGLCHPDDDVNLKACLHLHVFKFTRAMLSLPMLRVRPRPDRKILGLALG